METYFRAKFQYHDFDSYYAINIEELIKHEKDNILSNREKTLLAMRYLQNARNIGDITKGKEYLEQILTEDNENVFAKALFIKHFENDTKVCLEHFMKVL